MLGRQIACFLLLHLQRPFRLELLQLHVVIFVQVLE
jgi:hypothetical protein